jgi:hypothetical protein
LNRWKIPVSRFRRIRNVGTARFPSLLAAALSLGSLAGCIAVDSPGPGEPLVIRSDAGMVFGRIRVQSGGFEYRPWDPFEVNVPQPYLALLRLGPRRISPGPPIEEDGWFYWQLPPGDYAVIGNSHDFYGERTPYSRIQDMVVLALLRVPAAALPAYAGELLLEIEFDNPTDRRRGAYEFGSERVRDRRDEALAELQRLFGSLPGTPGVSLMCAGPDVPSFNDPELFNRGRALLDAGCVADPR